MILAGAGIPFEVLTGDIDEAKIKTEGLEGGLSPSEIGQVLARQKALPISIKRPELYVLGADQVLECEGRIFDKPADLAAAKVTLESLCGKTHTLISCAVIYLGGKLVFEVVERAHLTMLDFSPLFLDAYLKEAGEKILVSVGAYQVEAEGARLFERIEGDFFTILGLPLVPILDFLQAEGVIKR